MAILFVGNSLQDFVAGSQGLYEGPNDAPANSSGTAMLENINVKLYGNYIYFPLGQTVSEIYFSEYVNAGLPIATGTPLPLQLVSLAQPILRIRGRDTTGNQLAVELWNGTTFVEIARFQFDVVGSKRLDWYFRLHPTSGRIRCKVNGLTIFDFTGAVNPSIMNFDGIRVGSWSAGASKHGEIIAATENTEGLRVVTLNYTANGAETAWTGAVGDINWLPVGGTTYNDTQPDSAFITPTATEQTETFVARDIPSAFDNSVVRAVVVAGRGNNDGTITGINGVVRLAGTNYEKTPTVAPSATLGPFQTIFETNPATTGLWTIPDVNGAEFGYRSKA